MQESEARGLSMRTSRTDPAVKVWSLGIISYFAYKYTLLWLKEAYRLSLRFRIQGQFPGFRECTNWASRASKTWSRLGVVDFRFMHRDAMLFEPKTSPVQQARGDS